MTASGWICPGCEVNLRNTLDVKHQSESRDFMYLSSPFHFHEIITFWAYSPEIEALVHHVKYEKGWRLGLRLGEIMGRMLPADALSEIDGLMPVPLHPVRRRERGFNQSLLYCKGFQRVHPLPVLSDPLVRTRETATQTRLDSEARQANVHDAFRVKKPESVRDKRILLFDDVVTTGATMNACAQTLRNAGAGRVTGMALVRPDVRFRPVELS